MAAMADEIKRWREEDEAAAPYIIEAMRAVLLGKRSKNKNRVEKKINRILNILIFIEDSDLGQTRPRSALYQ